MFVDRRQAGELLAQRLKEALGETGRKTTAGAAACRVAVGLPRGGVIVAFEVARHLKCPLDILVSKKIPAPDNPELALGAVSSTGVVVLDERIRHPIFSGGAYEQAQIDLQEPLKRSTLAREKSLLQAAGVSERALTDVVQRRGTVIVIDDGIATGMTAIAALRTVRRMGAARVILAAPVMPYDTYLYMQRECDQVVAVKTPFEFQAVGFFYRDFKQTDDSEVITALKQANQSVGGVTLSGV